MPHYYPAVFSTVALQAGLTPAIWRSRRNYREGAVLSVASLVTLLVTAGWSAAFVLLPARLEHVVEHTEDISLCAGMLATATTLTLLVFIPKVCFQNEVVVLTFLKTI